ncbi:hypothetical protein KAH27_09295 [bacterium]|nr:hypothetical protein [bacterium]
MKILYKTSLAKTIDAVNEALFFDKKIPASQKNEVVKWIAERQGLPGSYAGKLFALTKKDFESDILLFTGEKIKSGGGKAHIIGEEACRILTILDSKNKALAKALEGMEELLVGHIAGGHELGTFCCVTCTCALWRNASAGGLKNSKKLLDAGMKILKSNRDDKGRWGRFPFYYTLLTLSEIDSPKAKAELKYCQQACEKSLKRLSKKDDIISKRRRATIIKSMKV